jgi:hypothetical protein
MADFAKKHKPLFKQLWPYFLYTLLPAGFSFRKLASVGVKALLNLRGTNKL